MIFRSNKAHFSDRINWKLVHFQKALPDSDKVKAVYQVVVNGEIVGAIGRLVNDAHHRGPWVWVRKGESFARKIHHDDSTLSRRWAAAQLIHSTFPVTA